MVKSILLCGGKSSNGGSKARGFKSKTLIGGLTSGSSGGKTELWFEEKKKNMLKASTGVTETEKAVYIIPFSRSTEWSGDGG